MGEFITLWDFKKKKKKKFDAVCNIPNSIMKMLDVLRLSFSKKKKKKKKKKRSAWLMFMSKKLVMSFK